MTVFVSRGKTVEVSRAAFDTPNKYFTLLDAPGQKSFVPNVISGACQADLGVLICADSINEVENGSCSKWLHRATPILLTLKKKKGHNMQKWYLYWFQSTYQLNHSLLYRCLVFKFISLPLVRPTMFVPALYQHPISSLPWIGFLYFWKYSLYSEDACKHGRPVLYMLCFVRC